MIPVKKSLHKSYTPNCGTLIKDFVNGTINDQEISPALANEPTLVQQCRRNGYMIIQIGDQLRTVYCNGGDVGKGFACPNCNTDMCLKHMEEHLGGTVIDPNTFKIPTPSVAFGNQNPPAYDGSVGGNMRAQMGMDEADKNNTITIADATPPQDREYQEMLQRRKENMTLRKSLRKQTEHDVSTKEILDMPKDKRVEFEVGSYVEEYRAAASVADIATEFASRGKDKPFQDQLESYAHQNENSIKYLLDSLVEAQRLKRCECGGYLPSDK